MSNTNPSSNPSVDGYIRKNKDWENELTQLRAIILQSPLTEEIKWRVPCYTFQGVNLVILGSYKDGATLSFLKGALLKDPEKILEIPGPNTQSARVIRFTSVPEITRLESTLKAYINEAIEAEKSGLKVEFKKITQHAVPEELQAALDKNPALNTAFKALTPGRQRAYFINISSAKQSTTRAARVEKYIPKILAGKGLDDE
jgi:uncharacterized protein YdeI (YjbR/CyaY-like superfamily)